MLCLHSYPPANKSHYCYCIGPHRGNWAETSLSWVLGEVEEEADTLEIICALPLMTENEELWAPRDSISSRYLWKASA